MRSAICLYEKAGHIIAADASKMFVLSGSEWILEEVDAALKDDPLVRAICGWVLYRLANDHVALEGLRAAAEQNPNSAVILVLAAAGVGLHATWRLAMPMRSRPAIAFASGAAALRGLPQALSFSGSEASSGSRRPHQQEVVGGHGVPCRQVQAGAGSLQFHLFTAANSPRRVLSPQALVKRQVA